jgi:predicted anti-sigma-YlaC factor YlaD
VRLAICGEASSGPHPRMVRALRLTARVALVLGGILLALYGLLAVVYRGDSGGSGHTYVTLAGRELDAQLVGAIALALGVMLLLAAIWPLRPARRREGER